MKQNYNDNEQGSNITKVDTMIVSNVVKEPYSLMIKELNKHSIAKDVMDPSNLNPKLNSKIELDKISVSMIIKYKLHLIKKELISETEDQ